ncbi:LuxR C-terminal-related transcriptional regulator [Flavobacterium terrisoli]|uniref:LuxR C-terminal-related transcriptional regulator n=1 Tax=Flavobacterium terrisoli TaxID=3242195 RepID=UPI002543014C|nr:LuxR C-terminal-related transcriptional regulator [Flavobacterium buctense]
MATGEKTKPTLTLNETQKSYSDESKNNINTASFIESPKTENQRQVIALLTLTVIMLCLFSVLLWKQNKALVYESSMIKSKLDEYLKITNTNEDLKQIQEEHRQQSLALNERQQKIVDLMAFGYSNKQIADKLFISENTVKYHIKNIYHVLHVKDRKTLWLTQS